MPDPDRSSHDSRRNGARRFRFIAGIVVALAAGGIVLSAIQCASRGPELPDGLSIDEFKAAERQFTRTYRRQPGRTDILSLAAEVALANERLETAVACFGAIPTTDSRYGLSARLQEGQVLLRLNRAQEAEHSLREFLSLTEADTRVSPELMVTACKWLGYIFSVELQLEARRTLLAGVHDRGQADVLDSKQFYFPNLLIWHTPGGRHRLDEFLKADPQNPKLKLALGRYLTAEGAVAQAQALLTPLHAELPADLACTGALLECCFERNDWDEFLTVASTLPEFTAGEPWFLTRLRGELALHERQWERAVTYFERLRSADPANPWCHMGLARAYAELDRLPDRDEMQRRSLGLSRIRVSLVNVQEDRPEAVRALASACEEIGLAEAAATFRRHAERIERGGP
jgi:predicted Zn-dependent protease